MFKKLPEELKKNIETIYTSGEQEIIETGFSTEKRKPSFRINTLKANGEKTLENLQESGLKISLVKGFNNAYILEEGQERDIWDTGAYKAGYIYMQGITSMLPPLLSDIVKKEEIDDEYKVLDLTAAPGSKTSQLASFMDNKGKIVAVDNNQIRIDKLSHTLKKQGVKNVEVIKVDSRNLSKQLETEYGVEMEGYFDTILFDAPCSAEGRINYSREKSYAFWKTEIVKKNYKLQKQIIQANIGMLKDGGEFIYSTCTLSVEENEAVVHYILCNFPEMEIVNISGEECFSSLELKEGVRTYGKQVFKSESTHTIRILPTAEYEGFFVAKFRKRVES